MKPDPDKVFFYVNGTPRLMMASAIAETLYPDSRRYLILLDQFDYNYNDLLPQVSYLFEDIFVLTITRKKYSHWNQFIDCYFPRLKELEAFLKPNAEFIMFGIRSPAQKFLMKANNALGNTVQIYAEGLSADRYFCTKSNNNPIYNAIRKLFPYAFEYQHDYKYFYVFNKEVYANSALARKIKPMYNFYKTDLYHRLADHYTADIDIEHLKQYPVVFFGQPLSNFDNIVSQETEEAMLTEIIGQKKTLVLPHPNEILGNSNKYECLPNSHVFHCNAPNDLLLLKLRPKTTITYSSTIGISYAMQNPDSINCFFPINKTQLEMLSKYQQHLPNISVNKNFIGSS